jgi:hypothetical protein
MMKTLIFFVSIALFISCYSGNQLKRLMQQENSRVAVFPFSGSGISREIRYLAADEWSACLFIGHHIPVVDRSQVNAAVRYAEIENTYFLSHRKLMEVSDSLNANLGVLGSITYFSSPGNSRNYLSISIRFLEIETGNILCMIRKAANVENCSFETVSDFIDDMSEDLDLER